MVQRATRRHCLPTVLTTNRPLFLTEPAYDKSVANRIGLTLLASKAGLTAEAAQPEFVASPIFRPRLMPPIRQNHPPRTPNQTPAQTTRATKLTGTRFNRRRQVTSGANVCIGNGGGSVILDQSRFRLGKYILQEFICVFAKLHVAGGRHPRECGNPVRKPREAPAMTLRVGVTSWIPAFARMTTKNT